MKFYPMIAGPQTPRPRVRTRAVVSVLIASYAAWLTYVKHLQFPNHPPDFGVSWFGANALLHGANPYRLVGPGLVYDWPWRLQYPATAFVLAIPTSFLPEVDAAIVFVFVSTALLAFGVTSDGWYRLPLFVTTSFVAAAGFAQWTILLTAAAFLPFVAIAFAAKPNIGLALAATEPSPHIESRPWNSHVWAACGGIVLIAIASFTLPSWPGDWLSAVRESKQLVPPLFLPGGPLILIALLRWRRWEARLILLLSLVPQTTYWYDALPLFLIPNTLGQSVFLALIAASGMLFEQHVISPTTEVENYRQIGILMVALIYMPATLLILRRPNEGNLPQWIKRPYGALVRRD